MKKILVICNLVFIAISCEKKLEHPLQDSNVMLKEPVAKVTDSTKAGGGNEGLALIEGADCLGCHKIDSKLVGPSYQEVADKYTEADVEYLANKIIDGGKGVWGEIPMSPHTGMSKENAKKMAEYILSLKKNAK